MSYFWLYKVLNIYIATYDPAVALDDGANYTAPFSTANFVIAGLDLFHILGPRG